MSRVEARPRLRFTSFALERLSSGQCRAVVTLNLPGTQQYVGQADGLTSPLGELRCAAQACIHAIAQAVHDPGFELVGVKAIRAFDATVVIVSLSIQGAEHHGPRIVGSCLTQDDAPRGAALAVLNGTNRLLSGRHLHRA
ncbi:MAG: hypothetical protein ABI647_20250 [Gemmatimonadota bacterium]